MKHFDFIKNAGTLFIGTLLTQALSATTYVICARGMPPSEYGKGVACVGVVLLAVVVVDFGGSTYAVRECAAGRLTGGRLSTWCRSKTLIIVLASPAAGFISSLVSGSLSLNSAFLACIMFAGGSMALVTVVPLRAGMRFNLLVAALVTSRILPAALACLLYVNGHLTYRTLLILLAIGPIIESLLYYLLSRWRIAFQRDGTSRFENPYAKGLGVGFSAVANTVGSLDISVVGAVGGPTVAGEYGAVNKWMTPIGLVAQVTTQALFPRMSSVRPADRLTILRSAMGLVSLSLPVLALVALLSHFLVRILLGPAYSRAGSTLIVLCLAIAFSVGAQPLSSALVAWRMERVSAAIVGLGTALQLGSQAVLAARLGSVGAAIGACIGQAVILIALVLTIYLRRRLWSEREGPTGSLLLSESDASIDMTHPAALGNHQEELSGQHRIGNGPTERANW